MAPSPPLKSILPLFLVLFIDGMGLGIIFPILNPVYMDISQGILSPDASLMLRNFLYGLTLFVFPFGMFFGTPILGDMSDVAGRKKVLLICLIGAMIGYFLSAIGLECKMVWLLILGRLIAGFTAASQSVAQAAIIDIAPENKKAQYIGFLMFPVALGFVAGPLLSGYLSDSQLVSWFTLTTPLYFAAFLSLLNAVYLYASFHDPKPMHGRLTFKLHRGVTLFISAFQHPGIRGLAICFLFMALAWSCYFQFVSLYLTQYYHYTAQHLGLFMSLLGLGFAVGLTYLVKYLSRYNPATMIYRCWAISIILIFITVLPTTDWPAWIVAAPIAALMSCSYSLILGLFSNQVGPEHQGFVMGVSMSVIAFGFAIMSIIPVLLVGFSSGLPLELGGCLLIIAALCMYVYASKHQ